MKKNGYFFFPTRFFLIRVQGTANLSLTAPPTNARGSDMASPRGEVGGSVVSVECFSFFTLGGPQAPLPRRNFSQESCFFIRVQDTAGISLTSIDFLTPGGPRR